MLHSNDMGSNTHKPFSVSQQVEAIPDRFNSVLSSADAEVDKPDTNDFHLGSPVTPLRPTGGLSGAVTNTSSSSSSCGSVTGRPASNTVVNRSHSGELSRSGESSPTAGGCAGGVGVSRNSKPGHRRSCSGPLIYSGSSGGNGSSVSSPAANVLPAGNICPSGKIGKTGMMSRSSARSDVLRSGTGNYGHGSIVRGGSGGLPAAAPSNIDPTTVMKRAMVSVDPEEVKRAGNEQYRKGQFAEALRLYDRAIALCPDNAACRSNKAAALIGLGRLGEAVRESKEAVRLDPMYKRAHQRLASLYLRLGQIENARKHLYFAGELPDPMELQKLQAIERHFSRCADARVVGDWNGVLKESNAAIAAGADSSSLLNASRAEALLRLHRLEEADSALSSMAKLETTESSCLQTKFIGMLSSSYVHVVRAQVEMALGRFENAELATEKARGLDPQNREVASVWNNVRSVVRARSRGNELFHLGKFAVACLSYGEGINYSPSNPVLYCNRAACYSKLGQWEKSVEDCNEALKIQPHYTKALLRRAASYGKLQRWAESVRDYEALQTELPTDIDIAEALCQAQAALKASHGEEVPNMKNSDETGEIVSEEQFRASVSIPGISVVQFVAARNQHCVQISPLVETLCSRYPSVHFLKVDVDKSPAIANTENVRIVPTFKIYNSGTSVKEMICPSHQVLECSVRHYDLSRK